MTDQPRTRQELYERIRHTSRDEFILEEMIRLGFWPASGQIPQDPADEIRRRGEIQREIDVLRTELTRIQNEEAMRREWRKRRLEESRLKQQETKARRERERQERATAWKQVKETKVGFLGTEVSAGLQQHTFQAERLLFLKLPVIETPEHLAQVMGITVSALRFLAFTRPVSKVSHYIRFKLPKKSGGDRTISAPLPRLKQVQQWILENILNRLVPHEAVHGFRAARSIVTNAMPHVAADIVINLDLRDFFPSIHYRRIKGLFRSLGYSEAVATVLGLLCTEAEVEAIELDGQNYFVTLGERYLPQGAPTSPALTNILCHRLDNRLQRMSQPLGFAYTRYADDLTFSASRDNRNDIGTLLRRVRFIVKAEGFQLHSEKTRVMRHSQQQEVTGVIVNQHPSVDNKTLKRFRALLYQIERDGPVGKHWGNSQNVISSIQGFANFVLMVNPEKGRQLKEKVRKIVKQYNQFSST